MAELFHVTNNKHLTINGNLVGGAKTFDCEQRAWAATNYIHEKALPIILFTPVVLNPNPSHTIPTISIEFRIRSLHFVEEELTAVNYIIINIVFIIDVCKFVATVLTA